MKKLSGSLSAGLAVAMIATLAHAAILINGAGATFPYPIYSKWFDEYHKAHGDLQINYQSVGSGAGIKQVTEGTVDFGASDGHEASRQMDLSRSDAASLTATGIGMARRLYQLGFLVRTTGPAPS
jgi:ABC-type phosphate transport system substrate-binding protein